MEFNVYFFLGQFVIICCQYVLISGKAIIGHNLRQSQPGEFLFTLSIMKIIPGHPQSGGDHFCTGVLITRKDALTSAHCLDDEELNETQLVIGTTDLTNGSIYFPFWWMTHDQWAQANNRTLGFDMNDMANVRLLTETADHIIPVRLSSHDTVYLYGKTVIMAGWGLDNQGVTPDVMNVVRLSVLDNTECHRRINNVIRRSIIRLLNLRLLCTLSSPFALLEKGDSGGPLLYHNKLIGINKAICPGSIIRNNRVQINISIGVHYYRMFIQQMIDT